MRMISQHDFQEWQWLGQLIRDIPDGLGEALVQDWLQFKKNPGASPPLVRFKMSFSVPASIQCHNCGCDFQPANGWGPKTMMMIGAMPFGECETCAKRHAILVLDEHPFRIY